MEYTSRRLSSATLREQNAGPRIQLEALLMAIPVRKHYRNTVWPYHLRRQAVDFAPISSSPRTITRQE